MRERLQQLEDQTLRFVGCFVKYDRHKTRLIGSRKRTLLIHIKSDCGEYLSDHLWLGNVRLFKKLKVQKGDIVSFWGTVKPYKHRKGYSTLKKWGITNIHQIEKLDKRIWQLLKDKPS